MKISESIALDEYLSEYPSNMTYDDIVSLLDDDDELPDEIRISEYFECWCYPALAERIENLKDRIEKGLYAEYTKENHK